MREIPFGIRLMRLLIVLVAVYLCLVLPGDWIEFAKLAPVVALGAFALWYFSSLCMDVRSIRKSLETFGDETERLGPDFMEQPQSRGKSPLKHSLLDSLPIRKLGDRVFKADESKTCTSCKWFEREKTLCGLDGESLEGITVSAVGCQHWSLGLKLTDNSSPETDETPG